jgi:hypothetical protein
MMMRMTRAGSALPISCLLNSGSCICRQYHGGTNFGRSSGGPFIATSYDYDAPIDEYGENLSSGAAKSATKTDHIHAHPRHALVLHPSIALANVQDIMERAHALSHRKTEQTWGSLALVMFE